MEKKIIIYAIAFMSIGFIASNINAGHKIVCIPANDFLKFSTDTSLACYYHFGYQTNDKQRCYIRFDMSPESGVKLGSWKERKNPNLVAAHFSRCRKGFPSNPRIIFGQSEEGYKYIDAQKLRHEQQINSAELSNIIGVPIQFCSGGGAAECAKKILGDSLSPSDNP